MSNLLEKRNKDLSFSTSSRREDPARRKEKTLLSFCSVNFLNISIETELKSTDFGLSVILKSRPALVGTEESI